jgi:hypothetical protein
VAKETEAKQVKAVCTRAKSTTTFRTQANGLRSSSMIALGLVRFSRSIAEVLLQKIMHREVQTFGLIRFNSPPVNPRSGLRARSGPRALRRTSGSRLRRRSCRSPDLPSG